MTPSEQSCSRSPDLAAAGCARCRGSVGFYRDRLGFTVVAGRAELEGKMFW